MSAINNFSNLVSIMCRFLNRSTIPGKPLPGSDIRLFKRATLATKLGGMAFLIVSMTFVPTAIASDKAEEVKVGDKAPDFSLPDQDGNMHSLKDYVGKKSLVLYFYPKDDIGVCKKEACLFRNDYQDFLNAGAEVIGISSDSVKSHKKFTSRRKLPFTLLSDKHGTVRKLYGVPKTAGGLLPGRVTFVIDRQGIIRMSYNSLMHAEQHVAKALEMLRSIDQVQSSGKS